MVDRGDVTLDEIRKTVQEKHREEQGSV